MSQGLNGREKDYAVSVTETATESWQALDHIQDLLAIESLIQSEADKGKIEPIISRRVEQLANEIDTHIKIINTAMLGIHNRAVIDIAAKVKDDLRELKQLLLR